MKIYGSSDNMKVYPTSLILIHFFFFKSGLLIEVAITLTTCRSVEKDNINFFVAISHIVKPQKFSLYYF